MTFYTVIGVSRRKARIRGGDAHECDAVLRSNADEVVCGDVVSVNFSVETPVITEIQNRKNLLSRSYGPKTKLLAANLDHLFIVSAVHPLFNTVFIDRTIAACIHEDIPYSLVLNKIDKGVDETEELLSIYTSLDIPIIRTSTKTPDGMDPLEEALSSSSIKTVALCGISGVGKSSLLKRLIPHAEAKTSQVSDRTGQGKQTTTMAIAYTRSTRGGEQFIIDLPGLQHFGISHIPLQNVRNCFSEFVPLSQECQFIDCAHVAEPSCKVRDALSNKLISESRYNSYLHMRKEIESGKPY